MKYFIIITSMIAVTSFFILGNDKEWTVSGTVTDTNGIAISSVGVSEKQTGNIVYTDDSGNYEITVKSRFSTLIFTAPGFISEQAKVNGRKEINIEMEAGEDTNAVANIPANNEIKIKKEYESATADLMVSPLGKSSAAFKRKSMESQVQVYSFEPPAGFNTEDYDAIVENGFRTVKDHPLSTFSIDVDAASYSNIRRFLNNGELPPAGAVRIEEMINYFTYDYPKPQGETPFAVQTEISDAPWNPNHKLALINLQGKVVPTNDLPASNLVFLIDVSGSMSGYNKLPLVKKSMKMLVDQLRPQDRVAIVVYAGEAAVKLSSVSASQAGKIKDVIENLNARGYTAGGAGIQMAYSEARKNFISGGNNRVILCTDGDFNIGPSSDAALEKLIENERESGVFLTVLGYGMGNYKDNKMQTLADKGNGNHAYIDDISEAKKVLVNEFGGTLFTIAKDVKLQVEFNPENVQSYRLIGYENRMLNKEDFNDDKKDAGELGSGHTVTALYEIIPTGIEDKFTGHVDPLKYQKNNSAEPNKTLSSEMMNVKLRYKDPDGQKSRLIEHPVVYKLNASKNTSDNFRFAAAVAQFGMILRQSEFMQESSYSKVLAMANSAIGTDKDGYRKEFIRLVQKANQLSKESDEKEVTGKR